MENRAFLIGMVPVEDTSMGNRALFDRKEHFNDSK